MAKLEDGEYVTIEEFIDGVFTKYLNNTGLVCGSRSTDECKKAECLAHYSYEKSWTFKVVCTPCLIQRLHLLPY